VPRRLRGRIRLIPGGVTEQSFMLNPRGRHLWRPAAVASRIEVEVDEPRLRWSGHAYFDMNRGDEPISDGFRHWHWGRAATASGAAIQYFGELRDGSRFGLGLSVSEAGEIIHWPLPAERGLPSSAWRIGRAVCSESPPRLVSTLVDAPFYARSLVEISQAGELVSAMHESLDLDRLRNPVVQAMLPFKMPRRARWP
jgi:carotenoid 1,2-hydratase